MEAQVGMCGMGSTGLKMMAGDGEEEGDNERPWGCREGGGRASKARMPWRVASRNVIRAIGDHLA